MANSNGWGDGAANNAIGWGQGANNAIGWGDIHADSWAGLTDIVGVAPIPPFTGLLDTYSGASVAYSLRQLSSTYTGNAIRVRRSSDNAEQDFGFVSNVLDTASLLTFCGAGNGQITTWYDQSGNNQNLTNIGAVAQPYIVVSGAIRTTNGKPHVEFDLGLTQYLNNSTLSLPLINRSVFMVIKQKSINAQDPGIFGLNPAFGNDFNSLTAYEFQGQNSGANREYGAFGSTGVSYQLQKNGSSTVTPQVLINEIKGGSSASLFENNSLITTDNAFTEFNANSNNGFIINGRYFAANFITNIGQYLFQEFIYWGSNQSANRTAINTNINTFYTIY